MGSNIGKQLLLSEDNSLLSEVYRGDNCKVIEGLADNGRCVIFFSGNALYYPNTESSFRKTVIEKDRYEWAGVASVMMKYVSRIILVRDIRKCWYTYGISEKYDTVQKTVDMLRVLCKGYDIYTYGNSAGGYMAVLAGIGLNAKAVFNWGGQIDLHGKEIYLEENDFIKAAIKDPEKTDKLDLKNILKDNTVPVYGFYAAKNDLDIDELKELKDAKNVNIISFDSDRHGQGFERDVYINLMQLDESGLKGIFEKYRDRTAAAGVIGDDINNMVDSSIRYKEEKKKEPFLLKVRHKLGDLKRKMLKK
ncbi:MAG: hypothetical protein IKR23_09710 [Lachnospiraceae bacterium]|nr:hypothetical protein [Lachnospiraceae bacterium]